MEIKKLAIIGAEISTLLCADEWRGKCRFDGSVDFICGNTLNAGMSGYQHALLRWYAR